MKKMFLIGLATAFGLLVACSAAPDPGAEARVTAAAGTRLPADIQSRASGLTWQARWLGDGLALFTTQVLAREAQGDAAGAQAWLCGAYNSLAASGAPNPQRGVEGDPEQAAAWGALWWAALRDTISDAGLRDLLHVLETNLGDAPAGLADVQAATDDVLRGDMSPYFAPWTAAERIEEVPGLSNCAVAQ